MEGSGEKLPGNLRHEMNVTWTSLEPKASQLAYGLCGLTPEEIKIAEEASK